MSQATNTAEPEGSTIAQPHIGDDAWLRQQFNWDDSEHLIKDGRVLSLVYDFEATDLNTMFAAPTQFAGKIVDIAGRVIDRMKIHIQVPEDVAISPQAAIVTHSDPEELYQSEGRLPPHIAAGHIMLYFRNPYRKLWDMLENEAIYHVNAKGKEEEIRVYTINSPDGSKHATIRLHQGGKFISVPYAEEERLPDGANTYHDVDGTRWRRFAAPAYTNGHNTSRYDDRLLWAFLHREMSDEIFLTHTKKFQRFRVDTLPLAKLVALLDDGGENGLKPGRKIDRTTGQPYPAFTLGTLMEANTREPIPERGLDEGVRMPDGSQYDRGYAHADAEYDVDANIALKAYLRKRDPEVVRCIELNSDFDRIKRFLIGGEGFEMHPLRAFSRDIYPNGARLHMGVCININEEIEERRQAVMIRTDIDSPLEDYMFRDKKLLDMSVDELAVMLESQRRRPDALCEILDLRKNPPVITGELAFRRGKAGNPDQHEANRRFVLAHEDFCHRLMQAHSKTMHAMPDYRSIRNPQPEEHLFTGIASPKRYEFEMDGKQVMLTETVHAEWVKSLRRDRAFDTVLRRALKPQTVEIESRHDTLEAFIDRMKTVDKHLQKYLGTTDMPAPHEDAADPDSIENPFTLLPPPEHSFIPPKWDVMPDPENPRRTKREEHVVTPEECERLTKNAVEYIWKLRTELMYEFHDNTTQFTVQDRFGHDIAFPDLNRMKQGDLADRLRTGEYTIHKEQLNWNSELIALMFRDAGRLQWVKDYWAARGRGDRVKEWDAWEEYFADRRSLRINGAPHEDTDNHRWMSEVRAIKECDRIEANLKGNDVRALEAQFGQWDMFMPGSDTAEPILHTRRTLAERRLAESPYSDARLERLGYDPKTRFPIEHAPYEIPADARVLTIDVPDRMLELPLQHHNVARTILMLDPSPAQREELANAGDDSYLFLRGAQSGRTYLAAKPALLSPQDISASNPYFHEVYAAAAHRYEDSGMDAPPANRLMPLAVEALAPVPGSIDPSAQTIKITCWEDFMATVTPTLGYRDAPLTGLAIKDYGFTPACGTARLQGMQGNAESGWEVPATITHVQTMTLNEARERIATGREQMRAAAKLNLDSVAELQQAFKQNRFSSEEIKAADLTSLPSVQRLLEKESFTADDALHYGYNSLSDMRSKLTALFVEQEREASRGDNFIHFVDIAPANKADMCWHNPAQRPQVRLLPPPDNPSLELLLPDPTRTRGAPGITHAIKPQERKRA